MAKIKNITPLQETRINPEKAGEIYDTVAKFADYGFNKSHAAAYGWLSYQTAYLRRHHPYEFMVANMNIEMHGSDASKKVASFVEEAGRIGLNILTPDINASAPHFTIEKVGDGSVKAIRYGLVGIRACGDEAMSTVLNERRANGPYKSLDDLCRRTVGTKVTKQAIESLIKAGALDSISRNRAALLAAVEPAMRRAKDDSKKDASQTSMFAMLGSEDKTELPDVPMPGAMQLLIWEVDAIGMCVSELPRKGWESLVKRRGCVPISRLKAGGITGYMSVAGIVSKIETKISKKKTAYTIVTLCDTSGSTELGMFGEKHEAFRHLLAKGEPFLFDIEVKVAEDRTSVFVNRVEPFGQQRAA